MRSSILAGHPFGPGRLRERWHVGGKSGSLRAAVFGLSDGLVSNLALILGVAGSGVPAGTIVVAGVAGLLAGAFSMGVGEYVSMRVQREIFEHALEVEEMEIEILPEAERDELTEIYESKGIPSDTAREVATALMADAERALDVHAREELGLDPDELGSPWGAALSSFGTFAVGAILPLLPFFFLGKGVAVPVALVVGGLALVIVGGFMANMSGKSVVRGALRMSLLGATAAGATYAIGSLFDVTTT